MLWIRIDVRNRHPGPIGNLRDSSVNIVVEIKGYRPIGNGLVSNKEPNRRSNPSARKICLHMVFRTYHCESFFRESSLHLFK